VEPTESHDRGPLGRDREVAVGHSKGTGGAAVRGSRARGGAARHYRSMGVRLHGWGEDRRGRADRKMKVTGHGSSSLEIGKMR
jgi:hypothetical protein